MFYKTRLKLTLWYLLIIMAVSVSFSGFIYLGADREFNRILSIQEYRLSHPEVRLRPLPRNPFSDDIPFYQQDEQVVGEARIRVLASLIGINLVIFIFSSLAGYFLAGRTLRPIKEMVDEQNRFVTDASHELNTPLTALKTSIEVNLRNKQFNLGKAREALKSNLEDVNSLQLLSDKLIKLSKYQDPKNGLKFEKINLVEVVNNVVSKVKPLANRKKIQIIVNLPKSYLLGESRSIAELFVILLDNAIKYSKENKAVEIKGKDNGGKIEIAVKDQGQGINKEDLPYIFDRFYRNDKSRTKQQVSGYGLGLSIAKRIVSLHNGAIEVKSVLAKGTTFVITFPSV